MKKIMFFSLLFFIVSCSKKETYYCECGPTGTSTVTYTTTISNATKSNASDLCYKAADQSRTMPANSYACNVSPQ